MANKLRSDSVSSFTMSDGSEDTIIEKMAEQDEQIDPEQYKEVFGASDDDDLSDLENVDFSDEDDTKQKSKKPPVKSKSKKPIEDKYDNYTEEEHLKPPKTPALPKFKKRKTINNEISDKYVVDSDEETNEKGKEQEAEELQSEKQLKRRSGKRMKSKRSPAKSRQENEEDEDEEKETSKSKEMTPLEWLIIHLIRIFTSLPAIRRMVDQHFDEILKTSSSRKRKRKDIDLDQYNDELAARLYAKMIQCADQDIDRSKAKQPAFSKMEFLESANTVLTKSYLSETLLENNIMEAIRAWMEPLPDRSLPPVEIQESMLSALDRLPATLDQLRISHIGKVVRFYVICPRLSERIRRQAEELHNKWARMILNKSADYRNRPMKTIEYDPEEYRARYDPNALMHEIELQQKAEASVSRMHARRPQIIARDVEVVPIIKNPIVFSGKSKGTTKLPTAYKRINQTLAKLQRRK
ncbi:hypothetical protein G9A89_005353 [Geosiphon pyriformis]|nr:hypothetical protein G9A89_005353 [Geosiphon pyriformis]